jgi:hypothetical protein
MLEWVSSTVGCALGALTARGDVCFLEGGE